jgi:hypothetical protein
MRLPHTEHNGSSCSKTTSIHAKSFGNRRAILLPPCKRPERHYLTLAAFLHQRQIPSLKRAIEEKDTVLRMEFKTFVNAFMRFPCQIVRAGRRLIYRLLNWNPWQGMFFRVLDQLRC